MEGVMSGQPSTVSLYPARWWSPAEEADALAMKKAGAPHHKIGKALNRSTQAVDRHMRVLIEREKLGSAAARNRPCITCHTTFHSSGPGNRMCARCRQLSVSPYAI
jgi:hypothetical protein